ncbi:Uncharacterised protein [Klebsiella pneumoniae]|nr:Uncharacterised protein [Klebsiella pneumoniae]
MLCILTAVRCNYYLQVVYVTLMSDLMFVR